MRSYFIYSNIKIIQHKKGTKKLEVKYHLFLIKNTILVCHCKNSSQKNYYK